MDNNASTPATSGPRLLAAIVLIVALGLLLVSLFDRMWVGGQAPVPFAWRDVALIHFACAVPLALLFAAFLQTRVSSAVVVTVAAGSIAVGAVPFAPEINAAMRDWLLSTPVAGLLLRPLLALTWVLSATLCLTVWLRGPRPGTRIGVAWKPVLALGILGFAALVIPPATYTSARCRHDRTKLGELLVQSRVGDAQLLIRGLRILDVDREWNGRSLAEVNEQLDQVVASLESRVATPLRPFAGTRERVERARSLAMLGRTDDALEVLASVNDPEWTPVVENLRGTIHETRSDWDEGLTAYRAASKAWEQRRPSPMREAGHAQAVTGIAFCLRKSGRYVEAEAAYQELLTLAPTAETHFLLAQFYEDAQQAAKARMHARRAMELAPDRYTQQGEKLIRKLTLNQFGCFGVFHAEGDRNVITPNPDGSLQQIR